MKSLKAFLGEGEMVPLVVLILLGLGAIVYLFFFPPISEPGCKESYDIVAQLTELHAAEMEAALYHYLVSSSRVLDPAQTEIRLHVLRVCSYSSEEAQIWVVYETTRTTQDEYGTLYHVTGYDGWITFVKQEEDWTVAKEDYDSDGRGIIYGTLR